MVATIDHTGIPWILDRFANDYTRPAVDDQQDVTLVSGWEVDGWSSVEFDRPAITGDVLGNDWSLTDTPLSLLWAYGAVDVFDIHRRVDSVSVNYVTGEVIPRDTTFKKAGKFKSDHDGVFSMKWGFHDTRIFFDITAKTTGWVGLVTLSSSSTTSSHLSFSSLFLSLPSCLLLTVSKGFSDDQFMPDTDMIIITVADEDADRWEVPGWVTDRYVDGRYRPVPDTQQDARMLYAEQKDGKTRAIIARERDTGDPYDRYTLFGNSFPSLLVFVCSYGRV